MTAVLGAFLCSTKTARRLMEPSRQFRCITQPAKMKKRAGGVGSEGIAARGDVYAYTKLRLTRKTGLFARPKVRCALNSRSSQLTDYDIFTLKCIS